MKRTSLLLLVATTVLVGCGGEEFTTGTLTALEGDSSQPDAGKDSQGTDVQQDAAADVAPDAGDSQVQPEAGPDAQDEPDVNQPDVVLPDAVQPDVNQPDVVLPDAGPDSETPDAGPDAPPDTATQDTGIDAQPDADAAAEAEADAQTGVDASPEADAAQDTGTPEAGEDAGCVEGARKCIGPTSPGICTGGKWIAYGGACNFGCTGEGVCRCTYVNDPWIQTLQTVEYHAGGAGCGGTSVEVDGMHYMPDTVCGNAYTQVLPYQNANSLHPWSVVPGYANMTTLMVQLPPITMTQCEDGAPFYAFERTYFTRSTTVSNCFWTSTSVGAWQQVILADGTVTQKPKTDLCQFFPMYYPY
jgi:hypothetical protein